MKEGRYNRVLDKMMNRIERVSDRMGKEFKNTRPFDQEPPDPRQQLYEFSQTTPEQIKFAREQFGNEVVDSYLLNMMTLQRKYQGVK